MAINHFTPLPYVKIELKQIRVKWDSLRAETHAAFAEQINISREGTSLDKVILDKFSYV